MSSRPEKVAGAVGVLAALTAVGAGLGIVLAGPIVDALNYHWLFWLPLILTVVAAVAAVLFVPESPVRTPGRISWLPAVLLSGWLVALLVALSEAPVWGWGSSRVIGLLAAAVVLAVAWVAAELRAATPLIDMKMMRRTAVWTNNLVALLIGVGMYATFAFLPEFVQTPAAAGYGFGASITQSGLMLLPSTITMFAVGMFAGRLTRALGGKVLVIAGCLIGCVAMAILAFAHTYEWEIYLSSAIMGVGFGLAFSAMSALVVAAVPRLADRRRERHEREHPHDRRQHRRGGDGQHRHLAAGALRAAGGVRLHHRVRGDGRGAGAGRAGRPADPGRARAAAGGR